MTFDELDQLILSTASFNWQKVAMVIAQVSYEERFSTVVADDKLSVIADRIKSLVADGRLVSQGDISNWRHSEIRLAT